MRRLSIVPSQRIAVRAGDVGRLTEHLRSEQGRVLSSVAMRGAFDTTPRTRRDWGVHSRYDAMTARSSLQLDPRSCPLRLRPVDENGGVWTQPHVVGALGLTPSRV